MTSKTTIGFIAGSWDLLHMGHILALKDSKAQCDILVVGLKINPNKDRPEKHIPIETVEERIARLEACKYVDKVITYDTENGLYNLLKELKPDIRFRGADHQNGKPFIGDDLPMKIIYLDRNHNYSSSNLIERIRYNKQ